MDVSLDKKQNKHEKELKNSSNEKNESLITKVLIKIYDVIEYDGNTYHCYKNKIYNNKKKICGLNTNDKIKIFDNDINKVNNKRKLINEQYLNLIEKLIDFYK